MIEAYLLIALIILLLILCSLPLIFIVGSIIIFIDNMFDINYKINKKIYLDRWLVRKDEYLMFIYYKTETDGYQGWTYLPNLISNYKLFKNSNEKNEDEFRK